MAALMVDQKSKRARERESSNYDSDDDDYFDEEPSEYDEVEKIVNYRKTNGKLEYLIKWAGWDDSHNEWIVEDNCQCTDLINDYWSSKDSASRPLNYTFPIRPQGVTTLSSTPSASQLPRTKNTAKSHVTRRPPNNAGPGMQGTTIQPKKQRKEELDLDDFREIKDGSFPPAGTDWEKEVARITAVAKFEKEGDLMVCLLWRDGTRTMHKSIEVYAKCPQKMLRYYEKYIRFVKID